MLPVQSPCIEVLLALKEATIDSTLEIVGKAHHLHLVLPYMQVLVEVRILLQ